MRCLLSANVSIYSTIEKIVEVKYNLLRWEATGDDDFIYETVRGLFAAQGM